MERLATGGADRLRSRRAQQACHAQIARRANMSQASALVPSGKSRALFRASRGLARGAFRDRHGRWERDAVDAVVRETSAREADGEVVWS